VTRLVRHRLLAGVIAVMAVAAYGGAIALIVGWADFGATTNARLPLDNPALAGLALLVGVGLPMTIAAVACWRGSRSAPLLAVGAGIILVGWILGETIVIRSVSWLQPFCLGYGLLLAALGWRAYREDRSHGAAAPDTGFRHRAGAHVDSRT